MMILSDDPLQAGNDGEFKTEWKSGLIEASIDTVHMCA